MSAIDFEALMAAELAATANVKKEGSAKAGQDVIDLQEHIVDGLGPSVFYIENFIDESTEAALLQAIYEV